MSNAYLFLASETPLPDSITAYADGVFYPQATLEEIEACVGYYGSTGHNYFFVAAGDTAHRGLQHAIAFCDDHAGLRYSVESLETFLQKVHAGQGM